MTATGYDDLAYITDGPFVVHDDAGLALLWSSGGEGGYSVGVARSSTGLITGPWVHQPQPLVAADGGHAMLLATRGDRFLIFHQPNELPFERLTIERVAEEDGIYWIPSDREGRTDHRSNGSCRDHRSCGHLREQRGAHPMIHGHVAPGFESIADAFERGQADDPGGAQLCVYQGGNVVVDLWAGSDPETGVAIDGDSLFVLWSTTKGMVAIIAALLIEQGQLEPDQPVSQVWPEFGVGGKDQTTVAHFLSHAAGLPFFPSAAGIESRDLPNWARCVEALAAAEPLWVPGTASWYHPFTFGYLNGEAIRRVAGKSVSELFAERIAGPLGVDAWIGGLPAARETDVTHRSRMHPLPSTSPAELWSQHGVDLSDPIVQELLEEVESIPDMVEFLNTAEGHQMEFGGAGGIASARSVAKVYAATIGEIDSIRLFSRQTLDAVTRPRTVGLGPFLNSPPCPTRSLPSWGWDSGWARSSRADDSHPVERSDTPERVETSGSLTPSRTWPSHTRAPGCGRTTRDRTRAWAGLSRSPIWPAHSVDAWQHGAGPIHGKT